MLRRSRLVGDLLQRGGGFWGQAPLFGGALAGGNAFGRFFVQQLRHGAGATRAAQGSHQHRAATGPWRSATVSPQRKSRAGLAAWPFTVTRPFAISSVARLRVL